MLPAKLDTRTLDREHGAPMGQRTNGSVQAEASTGADEKKTANVDELHDNKNTASSTTSACISMPSKFIKDLNEFITCNLCKGYLIDATTIIECLHSFCRACIVKYMDQDNAQSRLCPKCSVQIHKTKPKQNIRSDPTLQDIVYKMVPKLYKNEMSRRKEFYSKHPDKICGLSSEEKGEIHGERLILSIDDSIQLTIEYFPEVTNPYKLLPFKNDENQIAKSPGNTNQRRYLLCKAGMRVFHLKKFIRYKYGFDAKIEVDFFYKHELLKDDYTIMDLAYIYSWRRNIPIPLYYLIIEPDKNKDDYLWLLPQSKMGVPRPTKTPKKRKVLKNILEPTNCNTQVKTKKVKLSSKPAAHHLVSHKQRMFAGNHSIPPGVLSTSNLPGTPSPSPTSSGSTSAKINMNNSLNNLVKRKPTESGSNLLNDAKKPKLLKENNLKNDSKSQVVLPSPANTHKPPAYPPLDRSVFSEDDSSTDISETSFQIDIICNSESIASCSDTAICNGDNASTNIAHTTAPQTIIADNSKENHSNGGGGKQPNMTLNAAAECKSSSNSTEQSKSQEASANKNKLTDICASLLNSQLKMEEKNKLLGNDREPTSSTEAISLLKQALIERRANSTESAKENETNGSINKKDHQQNNSCLETALKSHNSVALNPSKPNVILPITNGQVVQGFAKGDKAAEIAATSKATKECCTEAISIPTTTIHCKTASSDSSATISTNTVVPSGNYNDTFPRLSQLTQPTDFFSKSFGFSSSKNSSSQANPLNIDVKLSSSVKPI